jgi:hypothetical protein
MRNIFVRPLQLNKRLTPELEMLKKNAVKGVGRQFPHKTHAKAKNIAMQAPRLDMVRIRPVWWRAPAAPLSGDICKVAPSCGVRPRHGLVYVGLKKPFRMAGSKIIGGTGVTVSRCSALSLRPALLNPTRLETICLAWTSPPGNPKPDSPGQDSLQAPGEFSGRTIATVAGR